MRLKAVTTCLLCLLLLAGCTPDGPAAASERPGPSPAQSAAPSAAPTPTPAPTPSPTPTPPPFPPYYFGSFLEESEPVEDDGWFDDAVFLGDSRTEGLELFGGINHKSGKHGTFYWKRGISVFGVDSEKYTFDVDGEELTMLGALSKKQYAKVYVMLGVNELGIKAGSYELGLGRFLDAVIAAQPGAVIYLQTLPPLNDELAAQHLADYERNANVDAFNQVIIRLAAEKKVVLLDTAAAYRGEDGQLPADMTSDGCHFKYGSYALWADYLRCHTIDPERYFYSRDLDPAPIVTPAPVESPAPEESQAPAESPVPDESQAPAESPVPEAEAPEHSPPAPAGDAQPISSEEATA